MTGKKFATIVLMNYKHKLIALLFYCSIVLAFELFLFPKNSMAASDHLMINEVYPNPETGEVEWIELYNPTGETIDLADFTIEDYSITSGSKEPVPILNFISVDPLGYVVLEKNIDFKFGLNNDSDTVILRNNGGVIDQVAYGKESGNAAVPGKKKSIARFPNGSDTDLDDIDFTVLSPTKGTENVKPVYSSDIMITEILPRPLDGAENEFIEIFNKGLAAIDLTGWQVDDEADGSAPYVIPTGTLIDPGKYLSFENSETGISLNDSGDSARLIDPNGEIKSEVLYQKVKSGQSYIYISSVWQWTTTQTSGAANVLTAEIIEEVVVGGEKGSDEQIISGIKEARLEENGILIKIQGKVTAPPGILSPQYFYLEDVSGGIQVYMHSKDFPQISSGNIVEVIGELSEINGERRLKVNAKEDIVIVRTEPPVIPKEIAIPEVSEENEGEYVRITGTVSRTSGDTFYVTDGESEVKVIIKSQTNIDKPKMRRGDKIEVSGVISEHKGEYRILPFQEDDVKIISSAKLPRAGAESLYYFFLSAILIFLWNSFQKARKKQLILQKRSQVLLNQAIFWHCTVI